MLGRKTILWIGLLFIILGCGESATDGDRQDSESGFGNNIPVPGSQSLRLAEDGVLSISLHATDADGDLLTYHIVTPPSHGTLEGTAPDLIYHPDPDYNGEESFTFKANDGQVDSPVVSIMLTITPVNDAPDTRLDSVVTDEDIPVTIDVLANDSDRDRGDILHIASATSPVHGTANILDGRIVYTPTENYHGADTFSYVASDGNGGETVAEVNVTVTSINDIPVARAGEDSSIVLSETITFDGLGSTDADGDDLRYRWTQGGVTISNQRYMSYEAKEVGDFTFTLIVTDPQGASSSDTVAIEVTQPHNETPTEYSSTFVKRRPPISISSGIAMDADIRQIRSEADDLIQEAEALIADKHLTLEVTPLTDAQKAAITSRKAQIEQEVQNHGN